MRIYCLENGAIYQTGVGTRKQVFPTYQAAKLTWGKLLHGPVEILDETAYEAWQDRLRASTYRPYLALSNYSCYNGIFYASSKMEVYRFWRLYWTSRYRILPEDAQVMNIHDPDKEQLTPSEYPHVHTQAPPAKPSCLCTFCLAYGLQDSPRSRSEFSDPPNT